MRRAGGLIARTVPAHAAMALFDHFFARVARAARGARVHGAPSAENCGNGSSVTRPSCRRSSISSKSWYADAHAQRKFPLVPLQNLLDNLESTAENMNTRSQPSSIPFRGRSHASSSAPKT